MIGQERGPAVARVEPERPGVTAVQPRGWLVGLGRSGVTSRAVAALIVLILVQLVVAQSLGLLPQVPMLDYTSARGSASR